MNRPSFVRRAALAALLVLVWSAPLAAAPRYTDKDTALELARVLDKGIFRGMLISSTFIQSAGDDEYLIKVVLENGGEQNWDLRRIRTWVKEDLLTLSRNRVLVFPKKDSNEFGVLDKNAFTETALRARVYAKRYRPPDVLAGRTIQFGVLRFNLVDLLDLSPGRDARGYLYRYVLDFENGQRDFLSYLDAWDAMQRGALMAEAPSGEPVQRVPYRLQSIHAQKLERIEEAGLGRFGVEMVFDRPVQLQPGHFPFRLFEEKGRNGKPRLDTPFVIEFTAPNAVLPEPTEGIENLEFLHNIRSVSDERHQQRVLLRANIAPEVLTEPPEVEVNDDVVRVVFTKVEDQSVFDREGLREAELRHRQERLLAGELSEAEVERRRLYRQHMETGLAQVDRARAEETFERRYDVLLAAVTNFKEAAINASSDQELQAALRERNKLLVRVPTMVIDHVRARLEAGQGSTSRLRELLRTVNSMTREPQLLDTIARLNEELAQR